jgi:hypothetical protein
LKKFGQLELQKARRGNRIVPILFHILIHVAQDKDMWRVLVNANIELPVFITGERGFLHSRSHCLLVSVANPGMFWGRGFKQIQLRVEGRENGNLGGGSPLVRGSTQFANE